MPLIAFAQSNVTLQGDMSIDTQRSRVHWPLHLACLSMDLSYDRCLQRLRSAKNAGGFDGQGKPVVLRILLTI